MRASSDRRIDLVARQSASPYRRICASNSRCLSLWLADMNSSLGNSSPDKAAPQSVT